MAKFCSGCGAPLDDGVKFCAKCGAAVQAGGQQPPPAQSQPQNYP